MNQEQSEKKERDSERLRGDAASSSEEQAAAANQTGEGLRAAREGDDELAKAKSEAADYYDKYLRTLAELENVKRRAEREKSDLRKYSLESFIKDMLPVLDSFDKALPGNDEGQQPSMGEGEWQSFLAGMQLVKRQLLETLERQGLAAVKAVGEKFDPHLHQAIQRQERDDVDTEQVGAEYSRGYTLQGRLLRPAMVSVVVPGAGGQER